MKITITVDCGNAAFEEHATSEVSRILSGFAGAIPGWELQSLDGIKLHDINGNTVGTVTVAR